MLGRECRPDQSVGGGGMKRHEPVWPVTELEAEVARLQQQLAEREKKKYEKRIAKLEAENESMEVEMSKHITDAQDTIYRLHDENERLRKELNFYDNKCEFCGSPLGLLHQESCPLCESRADIEELEADNKRLSIGVSNCAKTVDQLMTENERLRIALEEKWWGEKK